LGWRIAGRRKPGIHGKKVKSEHFKSSHKGIHKPFEAVFGRKSPKKCYLSETRVTSPAIYVINATTNMNGIIQSFYNAASGRNHDAFSFIRI